MGKHSIRKGHPVLAGICSVIGTLLIIAALLLGALLVVPGLAGMNAFCIASGSMEPDIPTGSLVLTQRIDPQTLEAGDVISYSDRSDDGVLVTHRVVENDLEQWELITQGDANAQPDPLAVSYGQVVGKVAFIVPLLGYVALVASSTAGKLSIAVLVVAGVLLCIVADRLRRRPAK